MRADNTVLQEAQNLIALTTAQTPLKGGESTPLTGMDFSGITPKRKTLQTPNPVAGIKTPAQSAAGTPARTPQLGGGATPLRDDLHINEPVDVAAIAGASVVAQKKQQRQLRDKLKSGLFSLPSPSNEYSIVMPELPQEAQQMVRVPAQAADPCSALWSGLLLVRVWRAWCGVLSALYSPFRLAQPPKGIIFESAQSSCVALHQSASRRGPCFLRGLHITLPLCCRAWLTCCLCFLRPVC